MDEIDRILDECRRDAVTRGSLPAAIRDPDDRMLLALAKAGRARFLVTGDGDLLDIERISGTLIVTSSEFLEAIKG